MPGPGAMDRGRQGNRPPHGGSQPVRLPEVKYFTPEGNLRPELVDEEARQVGQALANGIKASQLRRFYADVLALRRRFEQEAAGKPTSEWQRVFESVLPEFKMLRAKTFYAHKRSATICPAEMKEFIDRHVGAVSGWNQFLAFCRHFEAVVAYHKYLTPERD